MRDLSRDPVPQPGDVINQPGHPFDGFVVVSVYTRAQAIADGVIIDATGGDLAGICAQHFSGVHVAMTVAVAALIQKAVDHPDHANGWRGVWPVNVPCGSGKVFYRRVPVHGGCPRQRRPVLVTHAGAALEGESRKSVN